MRIDLTRERTRYYSRLEKLLEDALIKVSAVASKLDTVSVRDMVEALIAGEHDPRVLAGLARGRMKVKKQTLSWADAETHADGWMEVRHCLTHGLARGFRPEVWPGPLKGTVTASSVLRPRSDGKHSLSVHGAESCGHIYRACAQRLADEAASFMGHATLDWSKVPDFEL